MLGIDIKRLNQLGLGDASLDVVVFNSVANLSPDKEAVLRQVHHLLKTGGEFYYSDIYADRCVPSELCNYPVLYGYSPRCSCTRRTGRSRTSGEYFGVGLLLIMAPSSQEKYPPQNPGRFTCVESKKIT